MNIEEFKSKGLEHANPILTLNEKNSLLKESLIKYAPEISAEIESASIKKDCSCRGTMIDFLFNQKSDFLEFLYKFLVDNNLFSIYMDIFNKANVFKNYSGKIAKTTLNDWKDFCENVATDNASFRSFSVVKEGDDLFVFFL